MDEFQRLADQLVINRLRSSWFQVSKLGNEMAAEHDGTLSMAFVLLAINEAEGTPVTRIAPRMGMEPNSLGRILKSMEEKGLVNRKGSDADKRLSLVCLTDTGRQKRDIALKAVYRLEKAIIKDLDQELLKAFFAVTDQLPKAIEAFKERMRTEII
jgi:MarR family transcriptional regulator, organic hydroperoxide resistance regulator